MLARSLRILGAMRELVADFWDVNDALLRLSVETSIRSLLLVLAGNDEAALQASEQEYEVDKFARMNNIEHTSTGEIQRPRSFEKLVKKVAELKATELDDFDTKAFERQIYDELYRGTSTSAVHGLGPATRHVDSETVSISLQPTPNTTTGEDYASSLFAAVAIPATTISAIGDAANIDIVGLDDFNALWRELLVDE